MIKPAFSPFDPPPGPTAEVWKRRYYALWKALESYQFWLDTLAQDNPPSLPIAKLRGFARNLQAFFELQFEIVNSFETLSLAHLL